MKPNGSPIFWRRSVGVGSSCSRLAGLVWESLELLELSGAIYAARAARRAGIACASELDVKFCHQVAKSVKLPNPLMSAMVTMAMGVDESAGRYLVVARTRSVCATCRRPDRLWPWRALDTIPN